MTCKGKTLHSSAYSGQERLSRLLLFQANEPLIINVQKFPTFFFVPWVVLSRKNNNTNKSSSLLSSRPLLQ